MDQTEIEKLHIEVGECFLKAKQLLAKACQTGSTRLGWWSCLSDAVDSLKDADDSLDTLLEDLELANEEDEA